MNLTALNETYGESAVLAVGGWVIGLLFGFFAQRSKFCLRAAVVEFWHHQFGENFQFGYSHFLQPSLPFKV